MNAARYQVAIRRLTAAVLLSLPFIASCGEDFGPPDLESARIGLPAEYLITYDGEAGRSVLDMLAENASGVETSGYGDELLVISINGIANGTDGRYWFYYVNEEPGRISANRYETTADDRIEWLFAE